jgi:PGF-CTERM protein
VIPDPETDILYVNVDTGAAVFERGPLQPGDEFETELTVREESSLAASNQSIAASVTAVGAELSLGDVSLAADASQAVTGTTSVAPKSEVTVSLTANDTGSFTKTNTTTVSPNGTFATTFNLSETSPNTTVDVRAGGPLNASDDITVPISPSQEPAPMTGGARLTVADQTTTGGTVRLRNVTLADGGYVVIHAPNASESPVESVLGTSSYLENGTTENVTVTLSQPLTENADVVVMAHRDTNDNDVFDFVSSNGSEDGPYTSAGSTAAGAETSAEGATVTGAAAGDGEPVATTINVTLSNATSTAGGNGSGGGNGTNASGQSTTENGPGFGIVVAAVAVGVAVVVRRRRRE